MCFNRSVPECVQGFLCNAIAVLCCIYGVILIHERLINDIFHSMSWAKLEVLLTVSAIKESVFFPK